MENHAEYKGWVKVELMGHQSHIGYVSTEAYGAAVLFRIDRPAIPEIEETLLRPEWIEDQHCAIGSVIKRAAVEPLSVLVGAGSIYRIIPCSEEVAIAAIQKEQRRRKKRLDKSRSWKVTRFKCVECGKLSTGRLPRDGRYVGDGTVRYPRRHKGPGGKPCPGNIKEAEWVTK